MNIDVRTTVSCCRCENYGVDALAAVVSRAVGLAGGFPKKIVEAKKILLKPNLLSARYPEDATTTHPELVRAVIRELRKIGDKEISIGDSPAGTHSWETLWDTTGMSRVAAEEGVTLLPFENIRKIGLAGGKSVPILKELDSFDAFISLPKLKTHILTMMTGAVKNSYGLVPGTAKSVFHGYHSSPVKMARFIAEVYGQLKPDFVIMDAVQSMAGDGPAGGFPFDSGLLFAGRDAAAIDSSACVLFGYQANEIPLLRFVAAAGDGIILDDDMEKTGDGWDHLRDLRGKAKRSKSSFLNLIPEFIFHQATFFLRCRPRIDAKKCRLCGICAEACSRRAISVKNRKYRIDSSKCILCVCCMESCPHKAIELSSPVNAAVNGFRSIFRRK